MWYHSLKNSSYNFKFLSRGRGFLICSALFAHCYLSTTADAVTVAWTRQLGSTDTDISTGVSADGLGSVYISGNTLGSLDGPNAGHYDAYVSKYNAHGALQWTRQLGSTGEDRGLAISADGLGNVYLSGFTTGSLEGPNAGDSDAFVSKYDAAGLQQWTRQFGSPLPDRNVGVSADGLGNVYVAGYTIGSLDGVNAGNADAFVSKYDAEGALLWIRQLGSTRADLYTGVSADGLGNVYLSGRTEGSLDGPNSGEVDAFITKYDAAGVLQWTRQLGSSGIDISAGVSVDGLGHVYLSGHTYGDLEGANRGAADAFLAKYDAAGALKWKRQIGSPNPEFSKGVSVDELGNVYIAGHTVDRISPLGRYDAFVSSYDADGVLRWTHQFDSTRLDINTGVASDKLGNIYVSGYTEGGLHGPNAGRTDAFVIKINLVPEPASAALAVFALAVGMFALQFRNSPAAIATRVIA